MSVRRVHRLLLMAVALVILAGCGTAPSTASAPARVGSSSTVTRPATSTAAHPSGELLAVICVLGQGWTTIGLSGQQSTTPLNPTGDCDRYPAGTIAANNPPTASLYALSPDGRYRALWSNPSGQINVNGGPSPGGQQAGYLPVASQDPTNDFVDASGNNPNGFSNTTVQDSQVLFNPATGQLWWQRGGHLLSTTVPPGATPVDHGPGYLYTFTPAGQPMPVPYYDSPSGRMRAIVTAGTGDTSTVNVGPVTALTPICLQQAGIQADGTNAGQTFCGAPASADAAGCGFSGWVNDTTVVCDKDTNNSGATAIAARSLSPSGSLGPPTALTPATNQTIDDALVTPDGRTVLFFATGNGDTSLYAVPTDGSHASTDPTPLGHWTNTGQAAIVGWVLPSGARQPW